MECNLCGLYKNPNIDGKERLERSKDGEDNIENFIDSLDGPDMHQECYDNW